jgi:hypothetical protein
MSANPSTGKVLTHPASSSQSPSPARSPRRANSSPDLLRPPFDLVAELTLNRDRYHGPEWVSIHTLPGYILTCLERVMTATAIHDPSIPKPGLSPIVAACCYSAADAVRDNPDVVATLALRTRLHSMDSVDPEESEELAGFLRSFHLCMPNASTSGGRRQSVYMPNYIKTAVHDLADSLGVSMSGLMVVCIAITLADQPAVLRERREELEAAVGKFYRRVRMRRRIAEKWLDEMVGG